MKKRIGRYFSQLGALPLGAQVTGLDGRAIALEEFFEDAIRRVRAAHAAGNTLIFIGNGGSAAIASHMATDFMKNGGIRALAMNDASALTCLSNDLGYENVFAKQIEMHARAGDVLIAISSSGNSDNILRAVSAARDKGCAVITLSGFSPNNALRQRGDLNLYVPSGEYGFVEVTHLSLCHALLDIASGWGEAEELRRLA